MFKSIRVGRSRTGMHVVGVVKDSKRLPSGIDLPAATKRRLGEAMKRPGFTGKVGQLCVVDETCAVVGLGGKDGLDTKRLRTVAARLLRGLGPVAPKAMILHLDAAIGRGRPDAGSAGQAVGEGLALANWRVDGFDGTATKRAALHPALSVAGGDRAFGRGLRDGLRIATGVNTARRIGSTPPNMCHPAWVASQARALARRTSLSCRVISYQQAQQQGMGGLVAVGKGSSRKPCMVILEHKPTRAKRGVHVVLVGKTITFDTGGYSLKPPAGMKGMKYDKQGGAAVFGAMEAIAELGLSVRVTALLPAAENMVSDDAYRPDDIITMYNGVTVEVTNTDAEGRLVLADALAYACKKLKPTALINAATLTGGVVVALGSWCAGAFSNDDDLFDRIQTAADTTDERIWRLPLWEDHRRFMRAKHADIWNSGPKRDGHPIQGAAFLSYFVDEDVPWTHLDIAGVAKTEPNTDLCVSGPTGFGVRLLTETVRSFS